MSYTVYTLYFHKQGELFNMFEAKCKNCEVVYTIEEDNMPESFECLCNCTDFAMKENTLIAA